MPADDWPGAYAESEASRRRLCALLTAATQAIEEQWPGSCSWSDLPWHIQRLQRQIAQLQHWKWKPVAMPGSRFL